MFVGGLSKASTQQTMFSYFSRYGEVTECIVMRDPNTEQSRGFGFVTFREPTSVDSVLADAPHVLDNKQIDPKRCNPKQAAANRAANSTMGMNRVGGSGGAGGGTAMGGVGNDRSERLSKKIFVGGLPKDAKDTDVREFFSRFGRVTEAVVVVNPDNRQSRCFGFVSFDTPDPVNQLTQLRFIDFNGKQVEIKCAEPREPSNNMMGATPQTRGPSGRGRGMAGGMGNGDGAGAMAPWGMSPNAAAAGIPGPGAGAQMGQYPHGYGPMTAPWAAQQWAAMGCYGPAAYQGYQPGIAGMYGMPGMHGAATGMTMPMAGMNMAGMNMAGMPGTMPMPVGPPTSGSDANVSAQGYGGFNSMNSTGGEAGAMTGGYGQKSAEEYGRTDRNSYHPYKR